MAINFEAFGIDRLNVAERLELIEQIWDSLPEQLSAAEIPDWHLAVLAERRTAADAQPGIGRPWREVLGEITKAS